MAVEFGTGKTVFILAIVVGCFAVLWPKLFYPMLQASVTTKAPVEVSQDHFRQERPPHLRPEMLHPALRERGRAIPQSHVVPRVMDKEARPPPIPGMRPPMGGAGHVVPAPKTGGTMGIIMPIYTIGIVVFFMYTIMKMMFKKPSDAGNYGADPQFRKMVFEQESGSPCYKEPPVHKSSQDVSKLGWKERDTRDVEMDQLRRRLEETEAAMERIVAQMGLVPHQKEEEKLVYSAAVEELPTEAGGATEQQGPIGENIFDLRGVTDAVITDEDVPQGVTEEVELQGVTEEDGLKGVTEEDGLQGVTDADELRGVTEPAIANENELQGVTESTSSIPSEDIEGPKVQVVNMETTASGQRWSRPSTPVSRSTTPLPPTAIFLEGALPSQSQLLVADSRTQQEPGLGGDDPVVLSGKMTLSLISLDTAGLCEDVCTPTAGDGSDEQLATAGDNAYELLATAGDDSDEQLGRDEDDSDEQLATAGDYADELLATTGDDSDEQLATAGDDSDEQLGKADETADRQLYEDEAAADEELIKVEDTLLGGDEFEDDINTRDYQPPVPESAQHRAPARTEKDYLDPVRPTNTLTSSIDNINSIY